MDSISGRRNEHIMCAFDELIFASALRDPLNLSNRGSVVCEPFMPAILICGKIVRRYKHYIRLSLFNP